MKNHLISKKGLLATTSAAALLLAAGAANATTIGFAPGAASAGANDNLFLAGVDTQLNDTVSVDQFKWMSVNNSHALTGATAISSGTGGVTNAGELAQSWFLNITDKAGAGAGIASEDDTFTESFSFALDNISVNTVLGNTAYGSTSSLTSHVYMTMTGSGHLTDIDASFNTFGADSRYALKYTDVTFEMFVDDNGDFSDADTDTKIATFSGVGSGTQFVPLLGDHVSSLAWTTSWDQVLLNVFEIPVGTEASDGGSPGLTDLRPGLGAFKITDQSVKRNIVDDVSEADDDNDGSIQYLLTSFGESTGTSTVSIPEPGALAMLGLGLVGLGLASRRRRKASA